MSCRAKAIAIGATLLLLALGSVLGEELSDTGAALHDVLTNTTGDPVPLKLCECERATGAPSGLSCDKEGFFLSSFERQGQWVAGGGYVPLSNAICCRPCLPGELPPDTSGRITPGQKPLGIISLGCHTSTEPLGVRCEAGGQSFVSGFADAIKVYTASETYYPVDSAQCCTPALLLDSGDAWELERCGCRSSVDPTYPVNCGGQTTDQLLWGYNYYRLSPAGHVVPVGPAQCCSVCLSGTVHPITLCDDLNHCSGNGVCNLGRCECLDGWGGADCSLPISGGPQSRIPPWAVLLIVLSSIAVGGVILIILSQIVRNFADAGDDLGGGQGREPLLLRIDADDAGSVGSVDTDCDEDGEDIEQRIEGVIQRLEEAAGGQQQQEEGEGGAAVEGAREGAGDSDLELGTAGAAEGVQLELADVEALPQPTGPAPVAAASPTPDASPQLVAAAAAAAPASAEGSSEGDAIKPEGLWSHGGEGPLGAVDCSVCMIRPVQVVLVPCGHICSCRRCSRRLTRCPMCRKDVVRRQRLFI